MTKKARLVWLTLLLLGCDQYATRPDLNVQPNYQFGKPSELTAEAVSPTAVSISWSDDEESALGYELVASWGDDTTYYPVMRSMSNMHRMIWEGCERSTIYRFRVRGIYSSGYSEPSDICTFIRTHCVYSELIGYDDIWTILDLNISPDGEQYLLSDGYGVQLFETVTGKLVWATSDFSCAAFLPDGNGIIAGSGRELWWISTENRSKLHRLGDCNDEIVRIKLTADQKWIFIKGYYGLIEVREFTGTAIKEIYPGENSIVLPPPFYPSTIDITTSKRNDYFAVIEGIRGSAIDVFRFDDWSKTASFFGEDAEFSPDGSLLAVAGAEDVRIYDTNTWSETRRIPAPGRITWSHNGEFVIVSGGYTRFFENATGREVFGILDLQMPDSEYSGLKANPERLISSSDGRYLLGIASYHGTGISYVCLWI